VHLRSNRNQEVLNELRSRAPNPSNLATVGRASATSHDLHLHGRQGQSSAETWFTLTATAFPEIREMNG
jgi:hypothetical protein